MAKNIKNSKILVTGGAGFIGSHLVEELLTRGAKVTILDDFSNGRMENLESIRNKVSIMKYDISLPFLKLKKKLNTKFDGIFHLACFPRSMSLKSPFRDLEVNARGTLNVLEFARLNGTKVVFTSNSGIYGEPKYLPIDENHPNNPSTPYDANKLVSEYYMKIYYSIFGVPIAICRLATVYGERQRTKLDWKPVIPEFATNILKRKQSTICWDGKQSRDLIYVKDVVQGLTKAFLANTKDEIFILGTGVETSIDDIYKIICKILGRWIEPKRAKRVEGDIKRMRYSSKKANKWFSFQPEYSLKQGIEKYIHWLKVQ